MIELTQPAKGASTHCKSPGARYLHFFSQPSHFSITVPLEKPVHFTRNESSRTEGENQGDTRVDGRWPSLIAVCSLRQRDIVYTRLFLFLSKSSHPATVLQKSPNFIFCFPYHSIFLVKKEPLDKKTFPKNKTLNLFFLSSFQLPISLEKGNETGRC